MTSISSKKLNGNITLVKFIFCLCIVMLHYFVPWRFNSAFMVGGYIYVDFFFILQGFYLEDVLKHFNCEHTEREYAVSRLKRFFSIVAVQGLVLLLIEILFFSESIKDMALSGIGTLYQISFVSVLLDKNFLNNGTMWFLSAYVIGGTLVVFAIKRDAKGYRILAPIVSAMIYNYIIHTYGNIDAWWEIGFAGCLQYALPRAIAGISLGYFARGLYEWLADFNLIKHRNIKIYMCFLGGGVTVISVAFALFMPHTEYDFFQILFFFIIIISLNLGLRIPPTKIIGRLDRITLPIYIWQVVSIRIITLTGEPTFVRLILVLLTDILISIIWLLLAGTLRDRKRKVEEV